MQISSLNNCPKGFLLSKIGLNEDKAFILTEMFSITRTIKYGCRGFDKFQNVECFPITFWPIFCVFWRYRVITLNKFELCGSHPDIKVHWANMGSTWDLSAPDGPHVGPINLVIRAVTDSITSTIVATFVKRIMSSFERYFVALITACSLSIGCIWFISNEINIKIGIVGKHVHDEMLYRCEIKPFLVVSYLNIKL